MPSKLEPSNFFDDIRANQRRSVVLMAFTFLILYGFVNLIALAFGAFTRNSNVCDAYGSCTTEFWWNPVPLIVVATVVSLSGASAILKLVLDVLAVLPSASVTCKVTE